MELDNLTLSKRYAYSSLEEKLEAIKELENWKQEQFKEFKNYTCIAESFTERPHSYLPIQVLSLEITLTEFDIRDGDKEAEFWEGFQKEFKTKVGCNENRNTTV